MPSPSPISYISIHSTSENPFPAILSAIHSQILTSPNSVHRILIPTLFSPFLYPPAAAQPTHVLPFIHALRALLRRHANTILVTTLPLSLHSRRTGLTRAIETLCDGVIELSPFPSHTHAETLASSGAATKEEDKPQGMLKVHRLPVFHERGGGGNVNLGEDLAFTLSRRKFLIKPFSLPPVEGDLEAQQGAGADLQAKGMEF
ncbi:PAXNEB-domain-containing protein [Pseudovirgaria hyperparasitica]|uniref:Elongator complex protein 4 n=1 Tax=Pseudovirgaria hyperparasitica TaxID=470096 RepID=A0A6A6VQ19_9PEZI|nr:PAXNEB-domain-containing protein [Pseudovirgaria hyperparasitica]KAF2752738.1 PAXNEB-domain-containing protein [Pseudovirgaria hyperparasitica]